MCFFDSVFSTRRKSRQGSDTDGGVRYQHLPNIVYMAPGERHINIILAKRTSKYASCKTHVQHCSGRTQPYTGTNAHTPEISLSLANHRPQIKAEVPALSKQDPMHSSIAITTEIPIGSDTDSDAKLWRSIPTSSRCCAYGHGTWRTTR